MDWGGPDSCRFNSPTEIQMKEYVRRLNAKCRGETIEEEGGNGASGETKSDDDSESYAQQHAGSAPPGAPGDLSRMAGVQRRNTALKALERNLDDDDDYGGKLPKLHNRASERRCA
jgi:hypothetical protein